MMKKMKNRVRRQRRWWQKKKKNKKALKVTHSLLSLNIPMRRFFSHLHRRHTSTTMSGSRVEGKRGEKKFFQHNFSFHFQFSVPFIIIIEKVCKGSV